MTSSTITAKGQTTIPKNVREHLNLNAGDKVDFIIAGEGRVLVVARNIAISEVSINSSAKDQKSKKKQKDKARKAEKKKKTNKKQDSQ